MSGHKIILCANRDDQIRLTVNEQRRQQLFLNSCTDTEIVFPRNIPFDNFALAFISKVYSVVGLVHPSKFKINSNVMLRVSRIT